MIEITLALDLEGVLITNETGQYPRPGSKSFIHKYELLFGIENICALVVCGDQVH